MFNDTSYGEQFRELFEKIMEEFDIPIVLGSQIHDKPKNEDGETKYPYISYNPLTSNRVANIPYSSGQGDEVHTYWEEQFEFTISFVAVAKDAFASIETARMLFSWLSNAGQDFLMSKQIVHVSSTPISSRDFFLINDYERRNGFDCRLRLGRKVDKMSPRIEVAIVQPGTILNNL